MSELTTTDAIVNIRDIKSPTPMIMEKLNSALARVDWVHLKESATQTIGGDFCDAVVITLMAGLHEGGVSVSPVATLLPHEDIITSKLAHASLVVNLNNTQILIDPTYGYYAPSWIVERVGANSMSHPYIILPFNHRLPTTTDGSGIYSAIMIQDGKELLLKDPQIRVSKKQRAIDDSTIEQLRLYWQSYKEKNSGIDIYSGFVHYLQIMRGKTIRPHEITKQDVENMRRFLREATNIVEGAMETNLYFEARHLVLPGDDIKPLIRNTIEAIQDI
ncbi:hypothetical protein HY086_03710 [Candidatus Gottesmanbacteria bacterium]|nr:hypothetical protein [Candidatus Gottesmanbacteria bacterium]